MLTQACSNTWCICTTQGEGILDARIPHMRPLQWFAIGCVKPSIEQHTAKQVKGMRSKHAKDMIAGFPSQNKAGPVQNSVGAYHTLVPLLLHPKQHKPKDHYGKLTVTTYRQTCVLDNFWRLDGLFELLLSLPDIRAQYRAQYPRITSTAIRLPLSTMCEENIFARRSPRAVMTCRV